MPAPTPAPERVRTPAPSGPRPMSMQRKYRLRRTVVVLLLLVLLALIVKAIGGDDSAAVTPAGSPTQSSASTSPTAATKTSASQTATAATSGATTSATVPAQGDGMITVLAMPGSDTGRTGTVKTVSVEAEGGLGIDLAQFASAVRSILSSDRGWEAADDIHFQAVSREQIAQGTVPDIRITLASPELTDELCAPLRTNGEVSCNQKGRAVINAKRWVSGVRYYDDLNLYRTYLINHEVGHGLSHPHQGCPVAGEPAPIMLQQSLGLQGCTANPYPVAK